MARGNEIIASAHPQGKKEGVIISGTPSPGVVMEIKPGTAMINGRLTYQPTSRAIGAKGPIAVLLPDRLQGRLATDAYVSGAYGEIYWPIAGEELNMLVEFPGTGGGTVTTIGEQLCVAGDGTGALTLKPGAAASAPFECMEADVDLSLPGNQLVLCKYLGNQA